MATLRANTSLVYKTQRRLGVLLLVELIPVKEMKRLAHPRLRRVIVEAVVAAIVVLVSRLRDSRIRSYSSRKGLLHNVTQSIECEMDLPSLKF